MQKITLTILILICTGAYSQETFRICDSIFKSKVYGCDSEARSHTIGGSYPNLFDAFNINPSALPLSLTPIGIEFAYTPDEKENFALIKGQNRFGLGLSVKKADTTFFSPAENYIAKAKKNSELLNPLMLNEYLSIGTAIDLFNLPKSISLPIGFSYRYNIDRSEYNPVFGLELKTPWLSLGASTFREGPYSYNDGYFDVTEKLHQTNLVIGLKFGAFLFDYSFYMLSKRSSYQDPNNQNIFFSDLYNIETQILSLTLKTGPILTTLAIRDQVSPDVSEVVSNQYNTSVSSVEKNHLHAGLSYQSERLTLGVYHNYILYEDFSLVGKFYF